MLLTLRLMILLVIWRISRFTEEGRVIWKDCWRN